MTVTNCNPNLLQYYDEHRRNYPHRLCR